MARAPRPKAASRPVASAAPPAPAWLSLAAGAAFLAVYLAWLPATPGDGDSGEFTLVLATMGLAHPTGYAPYTLLGHGFVSALHALGANWAWAANAWSALGGAVAMGLLHAFSARLLARQGVAAKPAALAALLPVTAFGLNPVWSSETTLAEVNSWHLAWVAGALLFAERSVAALAAPQRSPREVAWRAAAWSVLVGLGLAHHATSILVALPLTVLLVAAARPLGASLLAPALAGVVVPLAAWNWVWFRSVHPAPGQWEALAPGLHATWEHVTGAGYRHYLGGFAPSAIDQQHLSAWVYPWLAPAGLALLAWPFAAREASRALSVSLAAVLVMQLAYTFSYGVSDPGSYFLPALALALAAAPAALAAWPPLRSAAPVAGGLAACGLLVAAWAWNGTAQDRRRTYEGFDGELRQMWAAVPLARGYVVWDDDMHFRLRGYQLLEGNRPGLVVVQPRQLMDDGARALFVKRHGIDPLAGGSPPRESDSDTPEQIAAFADRIARGLNAGPDSVVVFLPQQPSLQLLTKPVASAPAH
jgi:hypothetical protein